MMSFLFGRAATRLEYMQNAEDKLRHFAESFYSPENHEIQLTTFDTLVDNENHIHAVKVESSRPHKTSLSESYPLVFVHGYMNGALNFYRCLFPMAQHFSRVYSLDLLGWGLSSRPDFPRKASVRVAEDFFVESLEAWREKAGLEKMVLAGHSMGGYLSVAYSERYPERVHHLMLLSPVGVPDAPPPRPTRATTWTSWSFRFLARNMYNFGMTPATLVRWLPNGRSWVGKYVAGRLPTVNDPEEQEALSEYLYYNSFLKPSGANALKSLLNERAYAKDPLIRRIPKLKVPKVSFLYGSHDWMDVSGGQAVQDECCERRNDSPKISVHIVPNAGHLLMIDNPADFERLLTVAAAI